MQARAELENPNLWAACGTLLLRANPDEDVDESQLVRARDRALRIRETQHYHFLHDLWRSPPFDSGWQGQLSLIVTYYTLGEGEEDSEETLVGEEEEDSDSTVSGDAPCS
ncbi:hypothetical protein NW768_004000 [Fusarium equiseti]|uniref:Uncharacterized protein n=1 Tax=Fusarium equiseti TaxID=61235 RepID=A0ABQ8RJB0_FUSEQ|nr:hypothetical protein NW768_004000 [Fusarium equiseti]